MKQGWEVENFEKCIDKVIYTTKIKRKNFLENGRYPIVSQEKEIVNGYWNNSEDLFRVRKPVIIFGDHTQTIKYIDFDFVLGADGVKILQTNENINPKYFYYYLKNIDLGKLVYARHYRLLKEQNVSYPKSLEEQKQIVSILDKAFEKIDKSKEIAEKNLKNAKELFESYLQEVFENKGDDWEEKTLKEVCHKITDGTHQTPKYFDKGVIFLSSRNVTSGKIDWNNIKYIDEKQHIEMHKRVAPRVNDILLAKNGTTGVAAMVDRDVVFDIYVSLAHIRVLNNVLPEFMLFFINSPIAKKQFNKRLKGVGVPNLHLQEIREVVISFPKSLETQKQIVTKLNQLQEKTKKLETIYQQKLTNLEELKKSILQKAFNGELETIKGVTA